MSGYVLDASVAVTALTEPGSPAADLLSGNDAAFQVPSVFDAEVLSALRGLVRGGKFDSAAALRVYVAVPRWEPNREPRRPDGAAGALVGVGAGVVAQA